MTLQLKTKKLFYRKWPIKVECRLAGSGMIARTGPEKFIQWCNDGSSFPYMQNRQNYNKSELVKFARTFLKFEKEELQLRGEGCHFNIFLKDTDLLSKLEKTLKPWLYSITKPESDQEFEFLLGSGPKKTICDQLPHVKYRYKVTLKENTPTETRKKFLEWLEKYNDQVRVSNSSLRWLKCEKMWVQAPFFYVQTDKHLSMVLLYLGNYIRKTDEFILKDSINS